MTNLLRIVQKAITILIIVCSISAAQAQNWDQIIKANAGDRNKKPTGSRSETDLYGSAVAILGEYAVVGATGEDEDENGRNTLNNAGAAYILHYEGGKWIQVQKICASVRIANSYFGAAVAISGDYVIVGAHAEARISDGLPTLNNAGAAYIFNKNEGGNENWGLVKRITASLPGDGDRFGCSVGISGDYAVVGAYLESENALEIDTQSGSGSAYLFKKDQFGSNNWGQLKKLTATDRAGNDSFGYSVAIDGNYVVVGANHDDLSNNANAGSVYVFRNDNGGIDKWNQSDKLTAFEPSVNGYFGTSVALYGDNVVIGAYGDLGVGAAYIYKRVSGSFEYWGSEKKLVPLNASAGAGFGSSVSITERHVIVGAPGDGLDALGTNPINLSGSVYVYELYVDKWNFLKKVTASNRKTNAEYGYSVSIHYNSTINYDSFAVVGSPFEDEDELEGSPISDAGAINVISDKQSTGSVWKFEQKVVMGERTPNDAFARSVSISGNYAVVGAPFDDENATGTQTLTDAGSAYIFYNNGGTWTQVKKIAPITREARSNFGWSVSIDGPNVIVGAPNANTNGIEEGYLINAGAAYIFNMDQGGAGNWGQVRKLNAIVRATYDNFGRSVAISGNTAIVGAPGTNFGNLLYDYGSVYVFTKDQGGAGNWGLVKETTPPKRIGGANFGISVSISGDYFIAGTFGDFNDESPNPTSAGAAYIFKKDQGGSNNWGLVKKIIDSAPFYNDLFGMSVSMSGDYVIVGAYAEDENSQDTDTKTSAGSAFIFKKDQGGTDNWGLVKKIVASDRANDDYFGWSVSISGTTAIVGAPGEDENALSANTLNKSGSAYIFKKDQGGTDNWGQAQKITASIRNSGDEFGQAVSISETYAIFGVPLNEEDDIKLNTLTGAGTMYIFHTTGSALPVTLAAFTAVKNEKQVMLEWKTASEINTDYFEVQKSADAHLWETIGNVAAGVESKELLSYTFTDSKPFSGDNLYRLKTVDQDGSFAYSRIRSLSFENNKSISLYPNPVSQRLYVNPAELANIESIRIMNALGQIVVANSAVSENGIRMEHLPQGMYMVQIKKISGGMEIKKVVVMR